MNKRIRLNKANEHENIITESHKDRHDIQKYNFRAMEVNKIQKPKDTPPQEPASAQEKIATPEPPVQQPTQPINVEPMVDAPSLKLFETEVVDKILQKSDVLAESLKKLQEQFDKQEQEIDQKVTKAQTEAKEQGYKEGYQKAKEELQAQISSQKELYAMSIQRIDETITQNKEYILNLEKELSSIALDIAKEVIDTEVNTNSAKIANALARALLQNIAQNTQVTLKVFPGDLEDLKESLKDLQNIKLEADKAITKGGIIILSPEGNIDGNIQVRFETLKKSILGNKSNAT